MLPTPPAAMFLPLEPGEPMAGEPEDAFGLESGHQAGADPQADKPPSDDQKERAGAPGEQQRSRRRDQQQRAFDAARSETVEQHAEQGLKKREGEEIDAGEEPKIGSVKMERPHQIGRDDGVDVPEQIGEEIAAGKGSDDREEQAASLRWNGSPVCADTRHADHCSLHASLFAKHCEKFLDASQRHPGFVSIRWPFLRSPPG